MIITPSSAYYLHTTFRMFYLFFKKQKLSLKDTNSSTSIAETENSL